MPKTTATVLTLKTAMATSPPIGIEVTYTVDQDPEPPTKIRVPGFGVLALSHDLDTEKPGSRIYRGVFRTRPRMPPIPPILRVTERREAGLVSVAEPAKD